MIEKALVLRDTIIAILTDNKGNRKTFVRMEHGQEFNIVSTVILPIETADIKWQHKEL